LTRKPHNEIVPGGYHFTQVDESRDPTFQKIVKRPHRIYKHQDIAPIFDYLSQAELPRAAIAKLNENMGIPQSGNEEAAC
jgi:hypothetical protein